MTQEEKSLLLKDLCARSIYNVKCKVHLDTKGYCLRDEDKYCDDTLESVNCKKQTCTFNKSIGYDFGYFAIEEVKPYLRPLTSMTEEEKTELFQLMGNGTDIQRIDFYLSHYFDFRCLIPMGLALEAKEGTYKID